MKKTYMFPATEFVALHNGAPLLQQDALAIITGSATGPLDDPNEVD